MRRILAIVLVPLGLVGAIVPAGPAVAVALLLSLTAVAFVVYVAAYVSSLRLHPKPGVALRRARLLDSGAFLPLARATRRARVPVSPTL